MGRLAGSGGLGGKRQGEALPKGRDDGICHAWQNGAAREGGWGRLRRGAPVGRERGWALVLLASAAVATVVWGWGEARPKPRPLRWYVRHWIWGLISWILLLPTAPKR